MLKTLIQRGLRPLGYEIHKRGNETLYTPRPPFPFSRQRAPTCGAMRPATSDMGVNSGNVPCGLVTVS